MRPSGRQPNELRSITFERDYTKHAEGSVLVSFGDTRVLCNASVTEGVPRFLKGKNQGWLTAEYSMLPRATHTRTDREAARGKQSGRTLEISRLIGRALRSMINLTALGEYTIVVDCDVLQADGGTRTAAITGASVALVDAIRYMQRNKLIITEPVMHSVAAVSVGVFDGTPVLDLDYREDSQAETDMNVVMNNQHGFVEIQGTAEGQVFDRAALDDMLNLASTGIDHLLKAQQAALAT